MRGQAIDVLRDGVGGAGVVFGFSKVEQFVGPAESMVERADAIDDALELRAFLAELLRALGIVPDVRVFELAGYFLEPLGLGVVVKDTP